MCLFYLVFVKGEIMDKENRSIYESIVYTYFVSAGMEPVAARRKVIAMSDQELEEFLN